MNWNKVEILYQINLAHTYRLSSVDCQHFDLGEATFRPLVFKTENWVIDQNYVRSLSHVGEVSERAQNTEIKDTMICCMKIFLHWLLF